MSGNMVLGVIGLFKFVQQVGSIYGYELFSLGFNFNFGFVVDVNNNQNNFVIGVCFYFNDLVLVVELVCSYIIGIYKYNVFILFKYFSGYGNVILDIYFFLLVVNIDKDVWQ